MCIRDSYYLSRFAQEPKKEFLENGWEATQAVLATNVLKDEQKDEALKRAVELAPKLEEELGQKWLGESFTKNEARGREVLAAIGSAAHLPSNQTTPRHHLPTSISLPQTAPSSLDTPPP